MGQTSGLKMTEYRLPDDYGQEGEGRFIAVDGGGNVNAKLGYMAHRPSGEPEQEPGQDHDERTPNHGQVLELFDELNLAYAGRSFDRPKLKSDKFPEILVVLGSRRSPRGLCALASRPARNGVHNCPRDKHDRRATVDQTRNSKLPGVWKMALKNRTREEDGKPR